MKLPRVRLTVRRLMVAVAIAGALLGAWRLLEDRSTTLLGIAREHEARREYYDLLA
jgi:hypothetical protein